MQLTTENTDIKKEVERLRGYEVEKKKKVKIIFLSSQLPSGFVAE